MIVDTHLHPLANDPARYPVAPIGGVQSEWSLGYTLTAEQVLDYMAKAGVDKATLVQASTVYGYENTFCADCCARYPDRFVGVCCINPLAPDAAGTLRRWVEKRGMRGVRLFTVGSTRFPEIQAAAAQARWLDDPSTHPVWEEAERLRIPVDVQASWRGLDMVASMLERFPGVRLILDHMAGPSLDDGPPYRAAAELLALSRYPNLYLKFTTNNIREAAKGASNPSAFFSTLIERFGANRLLWGSNFPATRGSDAAPYTELVQEARTALARFSATDRDWMLGGTARELYPALGQASPGYAGTGSRTRAAMNSCISAMARADSGPGLLAKLWGWPGNHSTWQLPPSAR